MSRSIEKVYQRRIDVLKRRRDFLDNRVADYQGKDMSRDLAEASAIDWALAVVEANYDYATELIRIKKAEKEAELAPIAPKAKGKNNE